MSARTKEAARLVDLLGRDGKADRRTPHSAALRRLITAGNLLAAEARGQYGIAHSDLADAWDNSVDALRVDLAFPVHVHVGPVHLACACPRCTS